jgi:hypothetical protein
VLLCSHGTRHTQMQQTDQSAVTPPPPPVFMPPPRRPPPLILEPPAPHATKTNAMLSCAAHPHRQERQRQRQQQQQPAQASTAGSSQLICQEQLGQFPAATHSCLTISQTSSNALHCFQTSFQTHSQTIPQHQHRFTQQPPYSSPPYYNTQGCTAAPLQQAPDIHRHALLSTNGSHMSHMSAHSQPHQAPQSRTSPGRGQPQGCWAHCRVPYSVTSQGKIESHLQNAGPKYIRQCQNMMPTHQAGRRLIYPQDSGSCTKETTTSVSSTIHGTHKSTRHMTDQQPADDGPLPTGSNRPTPPTSPVHLRCWPVQGDGSYNYLISLS